MSTVYHACNDHYHLHSMLPVGSSEREIWVTKNDVIQREFREYEAAQILIDHANRRPVGGTVSPNVVTDLTVDQAREYFGLNTVSVSPTTVKLPEPTEAAEACDCNGTCDQPEPLADWERDLLDANNYEEPKRKPEGADWALRLSDGDTVQLENLDCVPVVYASAPDEYHCISGGETVAVFRKEHVLAMWQE